jgi:hypothetical protein
MLNLMLKFVNEGAVSRELLEKCSQLIAHRSKLIAHCSKLIAYSSLLPCDSSCAIIVSYII